MLAKRDFHASFLSIKIHKPVGYVRMCVCVYVCVYRGMDEGYGPSALGTAAVHFQIYILKKWRHGWFFVSSYKS